MRVLGVIALAALTCACSSTLPNSHRAEFLDLVGLQECANLSQISYEADGWTKDYTDTITFSADSDCIEAIHVAALKRGFEDWNDDGALWYRIEIDRYAELKIDRTRHQVIWRDIQV